MKILHFKKTRKKKPKKKTELNVIFGLYLFMYIRKNRVKFLHVNECFVIHSERYKYDLRFLRHDIFKLCKLI